MVKFYFSKYSERQFKKLPKKVQKRITEKLTLLKKHPNILSTMRPLTELKPATHRLRIGNYRLLLELASQKKADFEFLVLKVDDRKNIYK